MKEILEEGYIRLFRKFVDWEWYDDANTMRLFLHCLLLANSKDKQWRGKLIQRGSFISSQPKLAHSLKLSIKQIRGSLDKLKRTGELAVKTTPDYSVITVKNYDAYQDKGRLTDTQKADKGQAKGRLRATTNKYIVNSIDNISLSNKEKITKDEREILKNYIQNTCKVKTSISAYIRKLLDNGDYVQILEEEKKKQEREKLKAEKKKQEEKEKQKTPEELEKEREETQKAMEMAREKIKKAFSKKRGEN